MAEFCANFIKGATGVQSGAGFDVSCCYHELHAVLFNNILEDLLQRQFIRRLRYFIGTTPHGACEDSQMYIENVPRCWFQFLHDPARLFIPESTARDES